MSGMSVSKNMSSVLSPQKNWSKEQTIPEQIFLEHRFQFKQFEMLQLNIKSGTLSMWKTKLGDHNCQVPSMKTHYIIKKLK